MTVPVLAIAALLVVILAGSSMHRNGQLARRSFVLLVGVALLLCAATLVAAGFMGFLRP